MQYVNDDMDELFRRAAENYPLDTGGSDWEKVAAKLAEAPPPEPVRKKDRRHLLWLLLLIPFSFICNHYYPLGGTDRAQDPAIAKADAAAIPAAPETNTTQARTTTGPASGLSTDPAAAPQASANASTVQAASAGPTTAQTNTNLLSAKKGTASIGSATVKTSGANGSQSAGAKGQRARVNGGGIGEEKGVSVGDFNESADPFTDRLQHLDPRTRTAFTLRPLFPTPRPGDFSKDEPLFRKEDPARRKQFYAGLILSGDVTTVRLQKIEEAGFSYGLLLGYSFGKRWSLESGIYRDRKSYYSDGEYVGNKNIYTPPNAKLTDVRGVCTMYEIPLNVRYTFTARPRSSFFATAGISSYIMKQEKYAYDYYYYQTGYTHTYRRTYSNASRNLFSVIGLTGGYTRQLGRIGDLRVEPYIKLPIGKMGYGKLPLTSAGLHVGITRTLF